MDTKGMKIGKIQKKRTYLLIAVLLLLLLCGCAGGKKEKEEEPSAVVEYTCVANADGKEKLFVVLKNYHGDYWKVVIDGILEAAEKTEAAVYLGGIDNETDIDGQIALLEEAAAEGADGILLAPTDANSLTDTCKKIRQSGIPLVLIDSSINSSEFDGCYMTDNLEAGKMAAKEMLEMLYDAGNAASQPLQVGILLSSDTSQAMVNRVSGFLEYWADYAPDGWEINPDIRLNGGDKKKARADAGKLLSDNEKLKGLYGCNNTSTVGIANALQSEERTDVVMVGFDLAEETKQIIQDTAYHAATLQQRQDQMGYLGILSLDLLISGKTEKQKYFDTGVSVIRAEDLAGEVAP